MRMRSLSLLLLSALCCFPASGFAESRYAYSHASDVYYVSIQQGCEDLANAKINDFWTIVSFKAVVQNQCTYNAILKSSGVQSAGVSGQTPILAGQCTAGDPASITWPLGPRDTTFPSNVNPATATVPPWPVCTEGCKATYVSVDSCYAFNDQTPLFTYCDYNAKKTGEACSTASTAPKPDTSKCPPGTVLSGSSCIADPPPDPCIANPTGPGCTPPPDPCIANPTGPGCPTTPGGGGTTPGGGGTTPGGGGTTPGGGGTTPGGGGTTPGTGTTPGAAGGLACDAVFTCSGDSVGCATAQLEKIQMCNNIRGNDYNGVGKAVVGEALLDPDGDLEESEVHLASIIAGHARFLPSSCPPAQSFTVFGRQYAFKNDLFCNFAISMSWLVVAMASLTAALYIGQSFGSS